LLRILADGSLKEATSASRKKYVKYVDEILELFKEEKHHVT